MRVQPHSGAVVSLIALQQVDHMFAASIPVFLYRVCMFVVFPPGTAVFPHITTTCRIRLTVHANVCGVNVGVNS